MIVVSECMNSTRLELVSAEVWPEESWPYCDFIFFHIWREDPNLFCLSTSVRWTTTNTQSVKKNNEY